MTRTEAIARAIYIRRFSCSADTTAEHFLWYYNDESNPASCVHYSNVAYCLADARAAEAIVTIRDKGGDTISLAFRPQMS